MVNGVGRVGGPATATGPRRPGATGFAVAGEAAATESARPAAAAAAVDGGALLLQEVEAGPAGDRRARRHGRAMLDALAALQRELLDGADDPGALARLAALVEHCPEADDPALRGTVAAVALRARIEMARRGF